MREIAGLSVGRLEDAGLQRLRQQAVQLLNQVRGELTPHEQVVVPPLFVDATELARRAAKPLPPRVIAFVTQLKEPQHSDGRGS